MSQGDEIIVLLRPAVEGLCDLKPFIINEMMDCLKSSKADIGAGREVLLTLFL